MDVPEAMNAIAQLPQRASAAACFGEPAISGERVAIPVAEVMCAIGLGWGGGEVEQDGMEREGGGGGGGGGARARGIAVVEVGPNGVQVHPIVDETAIALARVAFVTAAVAIIATTLRRVLRG